jgi:hypothetical protein
MIFPALQWILGCTTIGQVKSMADSSSVFLFVEQMDDVYFFWVLIVFLLFFSGVALGDGDFWLISIRWQQIMLNRGKLTYHIRLRALNDYCMMIEAFYSEGTTSQPLFASTTK